MDSIKKLNEYTKIFNQESGEYLNLIGDKNKLDVLVDGEVKINDFDNGMLGNVEEYEIRLANFLIDQLDLSKSVKDYLDFIIETYYGFKRTKDETDLEFYTRVLKSILEFKCSPVAIVKAIEEYGDDIEFIEGIASGAFTDVTYTDNYQDFNFEGLYIIKAAFTEALGGQAYFFRIKISNLLPNNYRKIIAKINEFKAAGINYIIEIKETQQQYIGFADLLFCNYDYSDFTVSPIIVKDFVGG